MAKNKIKYGKHFLLDLLAEEPQLEGDQWQDDEATKEYYEWEAEVKNALHGLLGVPEEDNHLDKVVEDNTEIWKTMRKHKHVGGKVVEEF